MRFERSGVKCACMAAAMAAAAAGQTQIDLRTQGRNIDFSSAASTRPAKTGTVLPATCSVGEVFLKSDAAAGKNLYICTAANSWTVQGVEVPAISGKADQVLTNDGAGLMWQPFGGDVSGKPGALAVSGLNGRKLSGVVPLDGQFLRWNNAQQQWEPTTLASVLSVFGRTGAIAAQTGDYSFNQIAGTVANAQLPAASGDLTGSLASPTVIKIQGRPIAPTAPVPGQFLGWDGAQWTPQTLTPGGVTSAFGRVGAVSAQSGDYTFAQIAGTVAGTQLPAAAGDLSGSLSAPTVAQLQNRPVASGAPALNQVLAWNGSQWAPTNQSGGVTSAFGRTGSVTAQTGDYTFAQISGSVAGGQLPAAGGDLSGTLTSATVNKLQNRTMSATQPAAGQVLTWDGSQWTPQTPSGGGGGGTGGGGLDKTVANTYAAGAKQTFMPSLSTAGLAITPGTLPTSAAAGDVALDSGDANKLKVYDGAQWNTLVTIGNYTTTFMSQTAVTVNGTTHRLGSANLIVDCFDSSTPSSRVEPDRVAIDPLTYNVSIYFASAQSGHCVLSGSGGTGAGGGGASMTAQLGDLGLVQTSANVLTAGLNCSGATPCNVRMGNTVYSITNSSTITLSSGSGAVYLYVDAAGVLTAGHNLALTTAGVCAAASGVTSFPPGALPLYTWTATNGIWDATGGTDRRAFLSTRNISAGAGIVALDTGTQSIVAVDAATVPSYVASSAVLDFAGIAPGACAESTFALAGAVTGDSVAPGWPGSLENGLLGMMRVSGNNVVAVRICNFSGTTVDPAAATFRATVVRSF